MRIRLLIIEDPRAGCKGIIHLIDGISAEILLFDCGYNTNQIIAYAAGAEMRVVIPTERNLKQQREYDHYLCQLYHLGKMLFCTCNTGVVFPLHIPKMQHFCSSANSLHCYLVENLFMIYCSYYDTLLV